MIGLPSTKKKEKIMKFRSSHILPTLKAMTLLLFMMGGAMTSCIDEDLSKCGVNYQIEYVVRLETYMQTVLDAELQTDAEKELGERLYPILSNIYTDQAVDLGMSFYSDDRLEYEEKHVINNSGASYTIFLPAMDYHHFAIANLESEPLVYADQTESADTRHIHQVEGDTIDSHSIGIFMTYLQMKVQDHDQVFNVQMTMQNCGSVLILDPGENKVSKIESYVVNTATHYSSRDSIYSQQSNQLVRMIPVNGKSLMSMYAISFPSAGSNGNATRADGDDTQWKMHAYVTMEDGSTTENILNVSQSLDAAELYVIKASIAGNGSLTTTNAEVGVSVTLNWEQGGIFNPEI